jgi:hypothetical protein
MCAAGVRRSVPYRPDKSYPAMNRYLLRWHRRAANDNPSPVIPPYRIALLLTGTALVGTVALVTALWQA